MDAFRSLRRGLLPAGVLLLAACNANGQVDPGLLTSDATIVARDIAYLPTTITVRAGQPVTLTLDNEDDGVPHGLSVSNGGIEMAAAEIITGPGKVTLELPPLAAGSYAFGCPVHPNMAGSMLVAP